MVKTKGSHVRHTYLQTYFQTLRAHIDAYEVEGNQDEVLRHQSVHARRVSLDRLLGCDINWTPYDTHRATRPFDEFAHVQSISRHPRESAPSFLTAPATALITVSLHFVGFMERVLTAAQKGPLVIDPWYAVSGYMRWYFRISHPYMTPLRGDPPRPCEQKAIMEEQAELAGPLESRLEGKLTAIRGIADKILVSGSSGREFSYGVKYDLN
ncbi:hypothetical protein P8452_47043 [Trifolium repens]|nr:hypothetical protein P8452_47043 [Trifolium repens]